MVLQISVLGKRRHIADQLNKIFQDKIIIRHIENPSDISKSDDLTFCLSFYRLIKPPYFDFPKYGTFVPHASDLPKGRGWAPVNWALINGEEKIVLTTFKVDGGCDTGNYYKKTEVCVDKIDTIESAYQKIEVEILNHLKCLISDILESGRLALNQQTGQPTYARRRRAKDSELDPNLSLLKQWNLLRACDNDEYPAFFRLHGKKIMLRYEVVDE